jgi:hypothetical protein
VEVVQPYPVVQAVLTEQQILVAVVEHKITVELKAATVAQALLLFVTQQQQWLMPVTQQQTT